MVVVLMSESPVGSHFSLHATICQTEHGIGGDFFESPHKMDIISWFLVTLVNKILHSACRGQALLYTS